MDDLGKQLLSHADPKEVRPFLITPSRYSTRRPSSSCSQSLARAQVYLRDAMTTAVVTGCQHLVTARSELELASVARLHCRLLQLRHSAEIVRQADAENKVGSKTPEERVNGGWEHPVAQPDEHGGGGNAGGAESSEGGGSGVARDDSPSREKRKTSNETGSPRRKQKVAERDEDEDSRERDVPARASKGRAKAATASPTKARGKRSSRR